MQLSVDNGVSLCCLIWSAGKFSLFSIFFASYAVKDIEQKNLFDTVPLTFSFLGCMGNVSHTTEEILGPVKLHVELYLELLHDTGRYCSLSNLFNANMKST
jgi:hypothetical protein